MVVELEQRRVARLQPGGPQARQDALGFRQQVRVALELRFTAGADVHGSLVGRMLSGLAQCLLQGVRAAFGNPQAAAVQLGGGLRGAGRRGGRSHAGRGGGRVGLGGHGPRALADHGDGLLDAGHRPYRGGYPRDEGWFQAFGGAHETLPALSDSSSTWLMSWISSAGSWRK